MKSFKSRQILFLLFVTALSLVSYSEAIKFGVGPIGVPPPSSWSGNCYAVRRYSCIAECVLRGCYNAHCQRKFPVGKCSCQLCNQVKLDSSELDCNSSSGDCDRKCGEKYSGARGICFRADGMPLFTDQCNCWIH